MADTSYNKGIIPLANTSETCSRITLVVEHFPVHTLQMNVSGGD